ncbi:hypothetical protein JJC04_07355 [Flavobacterium covae]|nr:hypothetical protein [Flavobacterium covae]QYS92306.1 hypothetical protein JJC04_07355 [Flavobacterium covae]
MIIVHLHLTKLEVIVNFSSEEYCTPNNVVNKKSINEKHYSYRIKNNTIIIKNFNEYGNLYYKGNKLIGKKEMNYKEFVPLIFNKIE